MVRGPIFGLRGFYVAKWRILLNLRRINVNSHFKTVNQPLLLLLMQNEILPCYFRSHVSLAVILKVLICRHTWLIVFHLTVIIFSQLQFFCVINFLIHSLQHNSSDSKYILLKFTTPSTFFDLLLDWVISLSATCATITRLSKAPVDYFRARYLERNCLQTGRIVVLVQCSGVSALYPRVSSKLAELFFQVVSELFLCRTWPPSFDSDFFLGLIVPLKNGFPSYSIDVLSPHLYLVFY
jgi:hypothetical protein